MLNKFHVRVSLIRFVGVLTTYLFCVASITGREPLDGPLRKPNQANDIYFDLAWCVGQHDIGEIRLFASNFGEFGQFGIGLPEFNCLSRKPYQASDYPPGSHAFAGMRTDIWVGAIVGRDTLVSGSHWTEFTPDEIPWGNIIHRSIIDPLNQRFAGAVSEQDFIAEYTDTLVHEFSFDSIANRLHRPLGISVRQNSYAWSYDYAEDFVLFQYEVKNIGPKTLWGVYIGFYIEASVFQGWDFGGRYNVGAKDDDIAGFLAEHDTEYGGCAWTDTVNLAWFADNDADFHLVDDTIRPVPHMSGIQLIRTPADSLDLNFNWWIENYDANLDWGPQNKYRIRAFTHGGTGSPTTDQERYFLMANQERDYDQIFTSTIQPTDPFWAYPNQIISKDISDGQDVYMLLSFGPFNISPGQELPISFAVVMGKDFHQDPNNAPDNLTGLSYRPRRFMKNVHFDDIVKNALWASWVYDNPGVDTDGDGYFGKSRLCCTDTNIIYIDSSHDLWDTTWSYDDCREVFYEGDGVPDFRGASPPPAPRMWLEPRLGEIRVRWNGTYSENTPDIFTRNIDFEGYRVHMSLDSRESSYTLLASYDRENFDKHLWDDNRREWAIIDTPFTAYGLACFYGDSCEANFDPLEYNKTNPFFMPGFADSIFYFSTHEYNMSELGRTTPIRKVYPNEPYPATLILEDADPTSLTDDGYLKYFEYEYVIKDILPTIQYYVSVTVFDFGSPKSGLDALETSKTLNAQRVFAMPSVAEVEQHGLEVYVYPNPYRIDADYRAMGFEGRDAKWYIPERDRRIQFANLPAKCTIGIYSLDGDLIREIEHDRDPLAPDASHDEWDMITRNTQSITTGIYYWTVTDKDGNTQIGKFVVIK